MIGPREAVNTAMLAAAVGIDAGVETNIRAVVVVNDGARLVFKENSARRGILRLIPFGSLVGSLLEPISRIADSAPASYVHAII